MQRIFSPGRRYGTWRRLWLALAESQRLLGLDISEDAVTQLRAALDRPIDDRRRSSLSKRRRRRRLRGVPMMTPEMTARDDPEGRQGVPRHHFSTTFPEIRRGGNWATRAKLGPTAKACGPWSTTPTYCSAESLLWVASAS